MTSLRVAFAGTPEVAIPTLRAIAESRHELIGVITRPDAPTGRGRRMTPSAVAQAADELDVPLLKPMSLVDPTIDAVMGSWKPDVIIVVAYGLLIPSRLLALPRLGWVNAHFSALPHWRGAAPVQYAIAQGDSTIAVTTFRIEEGLDTGPVLGQSDPVSIGNREDAGHLLGRLALVAVDVVLETLDALAVGTAIQTPQAHADSTYAPRISTDEARIDWSQPVDVVDRWIRACTPAPGAWTTVGGRRIGIGTPSSVHHDDSVAPARIVAEKHRVLVGALGGYLELDSVQPMGKKQMSAPDWVRGFRDEPPREFNT